MTSSPESPQPIEIVLPIEGMTCASCVNRIERFLKKTPGVADAAVNLATEKATVRVDASLAGRQELVKAVAAAGYEVRAEAIPVEGAVAASLEDEITTEDRERERTQRQTLTQALVAIGAAVLFMVLMFTPQTLVAMAELNKVILWPATFIQIWAGGRFFRAAGGQAPHRGRWTPWSRSAPASPGWTASSSRSYLERAARGTTPRDATSRPPAVCWPSSCWASGSRRSPAARPRRPSAR